MGFKDNIRELNLIPFKSKKSSFDGECELIKDFFDEKFYQNKYSEFLKGSQSALHYFVKSGWRLMHDPNPNFSTKYYITLYDDVKESGLNPFYHYLQYGKAENRSVQADDVDSLLIGLDPDTRTVYSTIEVEFEFEYYKEQYLVGEPTKHECLLHYIEKGVHKGFNPSKEFSTTYYLSNNPDVSELGINPFYHFIKHGREENRLSSSVLFAQLEDIDDPLDKEVLTVLDSEFEEKFYSNNANLQFSSRFDAIMHYIKVGVDLKLDPSEKFSTKHYLIANPDIAKGKINPFYHYIKYGRAEGRSCVDFLHPSKIKEFLPKITAIVPNYNHEKFLEERIDSILNQSYGNIEILVLDDCSKDDSRALISRYVDKYPDQIKSIFNDQNSGGVFNQWEKGIKAAEGELIWICESDDSVTPNFIENLYPFFIDPAVMIAFGRIQFMDSEGTFMEGLDGYREGAWKGVWGSTTIKSAKAWFDGPFGIRNVIPNVGGCIFRKQEVSAEDWADAKSYKILGDWHLYSILAAGGKIVYEPTAISYFRQHTNNTSVKSFVTDSYYKEHYKLIEHLIYRWGISHSIIEKFVSYTKWQYLHHFGQDKEQSFNKIFDEDRLYTLTRKKKHIIIGFLGFHIGGGEIFPINLANALIDQGYIVSMLAIDLTKNVKEIHELMDSRIAVYSFDYVNEIGKGIFFEKAGIDLINTHNIGVEYNMLLQEDNGDFKAKYVVTLHGSYEVTQITTEQLQILADRVDFWVYTADKNLKPLSSVSIDKNKLTKTKNGMKIGDKPFEEDRKSLGIDDKSFVYGFMARGIKSKGWEQAIKSFKMLNDDNAHLVMIGSGEEKDRVEELYREELNIHFLGFRSNVYGFFKMCDCCILPTRFPGESYPLVLIQSMQVGVPIVSVDIGEIRHMLNQSKTSAGICIDYTDDDNKFEKEFSAGMKLMKNSNKKFRRYVEGANQIGKLYSISKVAKKYKATYDALLK